MFTNFIFVEFSVENIYLKDYVDLYHRDKSLHCKYLLFCWIPQKNYLTPDITSGTVMLKLTKGKQK